MHINLVLSIIIFKAVMIKYSSCHQSFQVVIIIKSLDETEMKLKHLEKDNTEIYKSGIL